MTVASTTKREMAANSLLLAVVQIGLVIRHPVVVSLIQQGAAEHIVGAALVAGHGDIPHCGDAQQGLDIRVVGLLLECGSDCVSIWT